MEDFNCQKEVKTIWEHVYLLERKQPLEDPHQEFANIMKISRSEAKVLYVKIMRGYNSHLLKIHRDIMDELLEYETSNAVKNN